MIMKILLSKLNLLSFLLLTLTISCTDDPDPSIDNGDNDNDGIVKFNRQLHKHC